MPYINSSESTTDNLAIDNLQKSQVMALENLVSFSTVWLIVLKCRNFENYFIWILKSYTEKN